MAFLDAYAAGNGKAVQTLLSKHEAHVYDSDVLEFAVGEAGVKAMFDNHQKLVFYFIPMSQAGSGV